MTGDGAGTPSPGQEERILRWLLVDGGLTQLEALQHLGVQRLAAMIYRLKGRGHNIRTELVEFQTRYGPAVAARYHLVHLAPLSVFKPPASWPVRQKFLSPADRGPVSFGKTDQYVVRSDGKYLATGTATPGDQGEPMRCGCGHEFDGAAVGAFGCPNCGGDLGPARHAEPVP